MLPRLNIVVAIDGDYGIGKGSDLPWERNVEDMKFFKELTVGTGKYIAKTPGNFTVTNTVIMGRVTYESLPDNFRPLPNRINIVISTTLDPAQNPGVIVFESLHDALLSVGQRIKEHE